MQRTLRHSSSAEPVGVSSNSKTEGFASEEKFSPRLEGFLARGGRVVLVDPQGKTEVRSARLGSQKRVGKREAGFALTMASAVGRALPSGAESIYLAHRVTLAKDRRSMERAIHGSKGRRNGRRQWPRLHGEATGWERRIDRGEPTSHFAERSDQDAPQSGSAGFSCGGRPVIWVDETLHGLYQQHGVVWLVQRYKLQVSLMLFWVTLLVLLWSMSGDLIRRPTHGAEYTDYTSG